jgi:hypothetical protein
LAPYKKLELERKDSTYVISTPVIFDDGTWKKEVDFIATVLHDC